MLLDSNILIEAAQRPAPSIWTMLAGGTCATASVVRVEVYGFAKLSAVESKALDEIFRHLQMLPLDETVVARAITLR